MLVLVSGVQQSGSVIHVGHLEGQTLGITHSGSYEASQSASAGAAS